MNETEKPSIILVVEDDAATLSLVRRLLGAAGHIVEYAMDGMHGEALALGGCHDLIVLDIDLPGGRSGLDILRELRRRGREVPVLLLTIRSGERALAQGFDQGADDYLAKPFSTVELEARVRALLRRRRAAPPERLELGRLRLDPATRSVWADGDVLSLTTREYELLHFLMRWTERLVSRELLLRAVWGMDYDPGTNLVSVQVSRLRQKLAGCDAGVEIRTVRAAGFILTES
jgi:two-component system, OmpR family, copper resistance phosphate regulon response regulator CusR